MSDERHRALRQAAAASGKSMAQIIDEALAFYGLECNETAAALVASARERAAMDDDAAMGLAVAETRAARAGRCK